MKKQLLLLIPCLFGILLLSSCVDPNYYGGGSYYGSYSYTTLPYGYRTVYVSGAPYYYYGNRWYRHHGGRYISCARPHGYHGSIGRVHHHGHSISHLPHGYRTVVVGGHRYYHHGSSWYRKSGSHYTRCASPSGYKGPSSHHPHYRGSDHHQRSSKPDYHHRKSGSYFERFKKDDDRASSHSRHVSSHTESHSRDESRRSHESRRDSGTTAYAKSHSGDHSRIKSISTGDKPMLHAFSRSRPSAPPSSTKSDRSSKRTDSRAHSHPSGDREDHKARTSGHR